jgi:hypothetical protein
MEVISDMKEICNDNNNTNNLEVDSFLIDSLKNQKDCSFILKIDEEMELFMKDPTQNQKKFPSMNGYQRMIVHKIAHYYKLSHFYLNDKNAVTVLKTESSEIPVLRLKDLTEEPEEVPSVKLLKKPKSKESLEEKKNTVILKIMKGNNEVENNDVDVKTTKYSPPENVKILKKPEKKT